MFWTLEFGMPIVVRFLDLFLFPKLGHTMLIVGMIMDYGLPLNRVQCRINSNSEVLSHACGNLNEDLQDLESDHIIDLSPVCRKKRTNTARIYKNSKVPKKPKTPSKIVIK